MAVVKNNPILEGLSGMLGRTIVYRQMKSPSTGLMMTIVQCAPVRTAPYNEAQRRQQGRFKEAMAHARELLSDPEVKAEYTRRAKAKGWHWNAFNLAVSEYLKKGEVACPPPAAIATATCSRPKVTQHHRKTKLSVCKRKELSRVFVNSKGELVVAKPKYSSDKCWGLSPPFDLAGVLKDIGNSIFQRFTYWR